MNGFGKMAQRMLSNVVRLGIGLVDDSQALQKMQIRLNALQTIDGVPNPQCFGLTSRVPDGAEAIVAFSGGDRGNGVVISTHHAASRPKSLSAGESTLYNQVGIRIYLSQAGLVIEAAGLPVSLNNAPTVTINADTKVSLNTAELAVSGKITAGGDVTDNADSGGKSMASMRETYDGHDHLIKGVQGGLDQVTSDKPNQQV